jgi:hypothetical protein
VKEETEKAKSIIAAIEQFGGRCERVQAGQWRTTGGYVHGARAGTPDWIVLLWHGRSFWAEIKTGDDADRDKKLNEDQRAWRDWARRHGHLVFTIRTPTEAVEACKEALR